jgi:hypothetical protein
VIFSWFSREIFIIINTSSISFSDIYDYNGKKFGVIFPFSSFSEVVAVVVSKSHVWQTVFRGEIGSFILTSFRKKMAISSWPAKN